MKIINKVVAIKGRIWELGGVLGAENVTKFMMSHEN